MKPVVLSAILLIGATVANAQENKEQHKAPVTEVRQAAVAFLEGLSPELRKQASFTMDDKERRAWSNLPTTSFKREGVSFKEMSPEQRSLAHQLLQSTLSSQGYLKTTGIMHLDEILKSLAEKRRPTNTPMLDMIFTGSDLKFRVRKNSFRLGRHREGQALLLPATWTHRDHRVR